MRMKEKLQKALAGQQNKDETGAGRRRQDCGQAPGWVKALHGCVFALLPIGMFYLMEFYEHNPFEEVRGEAQFFNILLFELLGWLLFFLLGSGRAAIRILGAVALVFGLVNHYVMAFRSTPLCALGYFLCENGGNSGRKL